MPIYEFKCRQCGKILEKFIHNLNNVISSCPDCGSNNLEKLISASYMVRTESNAPGRTCCGRAERCEASPCSTGNTCTRR